MKKRLMVLVFIIAVCCGIIGKATVARAKNTTVGFYGVETNTDIKAELFHSMSNALLNICYVEGEDDILLDVSDPVRIINSNGYLALVYLNGECEYLLQILIDNGEYLITYGKDYAKELSSLHDAECYCIELDNSTYVVGNDGTVYDLSGENRIDSICFEEEIVRGITCEPIKKNRVPFGESTKGLVGKTLTVSNVIINNGNYCWLCSSLSMCRYYGSSVSTTTAHNYVHSSHSYTACTGGTKSDIYNLISHYTGKSAQWASSGTSMQCDAAHTLTSIQSNIPILAWMSRVDSSGVRRNHTVIIKGYTLNNTTGEFTYEIVDPNYTYTKYQTSTYSAATMKYQQTSGRQYTWEDCLYGWN